MKTIENLMSHLNPFDVPTMENLYVEAGEEEEDVEPFPMPESVKELEKFRRRRIQMEV